MGGTDGRLRQLRCDVNKKDSYVVAIVFFRFRYGDELGGWILVTHFAPLGQTQVVQCVR